MYIRHILSIPILFIYSYPIYLFHSIPPSCQSGRRIHEEKERRTRKKRKKNLWREGGGSSNVGHWLTSLERMGGSPSSWNERKERLSFHHPSKTDGWKKTSTKAIPCDPLRVGSLLSIHRKRAKPLKCFNNRERENPAGWICCKVQSLSLSLSYISFYLSPF